MTQRSPEQSYREPAMCSLAEEDETTEQGVVLFRWRKRWSPVDAVGYGGEWDWVVTETRQVIEYGFWFRRTRWETRQWYSRTKVIWRDMATGKTGGLRTNDRLEAYANAVLARQRIAQLQKGTR